MRTRTSLFTACTALVVGSVAVLSVRAASPNDALGVEQAPTGLVQAVAAAEQHVPGSRASRAEYEHSRHHGWIYDIEVVAAGQVFDVKVDARSGAVVASAPDRADHEGDRDSDHDAHD